MLRQIFDDLGLACRLKPQSHQSFFDLSFPLRHVRFLSSSLHSTRSVANHSQRNETIGSTREARRAGIYPASRDTISMTEIPATIVSASVGLSPYNRSTMKWPRMR